MKLLALYWSFLIIGYIIAWRSAKKGKTFPGLAKAMMVTVYGLCLIMGLRMGANEQVIENLGTIGLMSLVITICCIAGSLGAIFLTRKIFGMDRKGRFIADLAAAEAKAGGGTLAGGTDSEGTGQPNQAEEQGSMDLKSTFMILGIVAAGMLIGAFFILRQTPEVLQLFDVASNDALIVLLCILMFFVGLDLGGSEEVIRSIRRAGFRVLVFPFATMIGTMVAGVAVCLLMGLTLKEGSAICVGFGWYSYAPIVIASAGQQYMIASAISFMHNVIREVTGIIFIPLVAKKIGYLESTGVPGIAAMDVCLPIVERSCGPNLVVYAFATGVIMCIVTSLGVPLIMGV